MSDSNGDATPSWERFRSALSDYQILRRYLSPALGLIVTVIFGLVFDKPFGWFSGMPQWAFLALVAILSWGASWVLLRSLLIYVSELRPKIQTIERLGKHVPQSALEQLCNAYELAAQKKDNRSLAHANEAFGLFQKAWNREEELAPVLSALNETLETLDIPYAINRVFQTELEKLKNMLKDLRDGSILHNYPIDEQFVLAGYVAQSYIKPHRNRLLTSVYATSLDLPSAFMEGFGRAYFHRLAGLTVSEPIAADNQHAGDEMPAIHRTGTFDEDRTFGAFHEYLGHETNRLSTLSNQGEVPAREFEAVKEPLEAPQKARIVVCTLERFLGEIVKAGKWEKTYPHGFVNFNVWHGVNEFALRFLVLDDYGQTLDRLGQELPGTAAQNSLESMLEGYVKDLNASVEESGKREDHDIDDFIVYNQDVVFGRVNPVPRSDSRVDLRMISGPQNRQAIASYYHFFRYIWKHPHCYSLSDMLIRMQTEGQRMIEQQNMSSDFIEGTQTPWSEISMEDLVVSVQKIAQQVAAALSPPSA